MPSPRERRRNNVRAGIFATVTIIIAVAVIIVLSDVQQLFAVKRNEYVAVFSVHDGVKSLSAGSDVRVGGLPLGKVTGVELIADDDGSLREEIAVEFSLDRNVELFPDARIQIGAALIGSGAWIDITDLGTAVDAFGTSRDPIPNRGRLSGTAPPGMLADIAGPDAAAILDNVKRASEFLGSMDEKYDRDVRPVLQDAKSATSDVRTMVSELRQEHFPTWAASIDEVMAWTGGFTDDVDAAIAEGRGMLEAGRTLVVENRPDVDATIDNFRSGSARFDQITVELQEGTLARVNTVLEKAGDAVDNATAVTERFRVDYEGWSADVGETLGDARLAGQQLKLAMVEIRRSPWKILYRPSDTELEHEMLYEAARSFALATADLKAASVSVERILDTHGDQLQEDPELLERVQRNLVDPLRNYEAAQQRLLDVLLLER